VIKRDPPITSAMVDRLTHKVQVIDMTGESYRLRETFNENGKSIDSLKGVV